MKTYIKPSMIISDVHTGALMEGSLKYDSSQTVTPGTGNGSGGWTRQLWAEEEEEQGM